MMSNQDPWNASGIDPLHKLELARNEITRLRAALAEAERDISRLDYLQSISVDSAELFPDMPRALVFRAPYDGDRALSVRAAIDAAMAWEEE